MAKYKPQHARLQYIDRLPVDFPNTKTIRRRALVDVGGTLKLNERYRAAAHATLMDSPFSLSIVWFSILNL